MRSNRLLWRLVPLALLASLVLAPAAYASNDGRGFYGATDDKVVTDAGFILIVFFPLFIFAMSRSRVTSRSARKRAKRQPRRSWAAPTWAAAGSSRRDGAARAERAR